MQGHYTSSPRKKDLEEGSMFNAMDAAGASFKFHQQLRKRDALLA